MKPIPGSKFDAKDITTILTDHKRELVPWQLLPLAVTLQACALVPLER